MGLLQGVVLCVLPRKGEVAHWGGVACVLRRVAQIACGCKMGGGAAGQGFGTNAEDRSRQTGRSPTVGGSAP